jgi:putative heme-binding domain-containing protein
VAFSGNAGAQELVAQLLRDARLGEPQMLFLLDTIDASTAKQFPDAWKEPLARPLRRPSPGVQMRTVELIRARALTGFDDQVQALSRDTAAPDQMRASALGVLVMGNPRLARDQFAFLLSRLTPNSDAVLRQTAARVIGRSAPDCDELLQIAHTRLGQADPLTLSTVLECFGTSRDEAVGEAVVTVLRRSPAALTTLGEDQLKRLLTGYPEKVRQDSEPLFQQLRDAQRERIDRLRKLELLLTAGGDVGRGRRIFFGEKVACSSCHTIGAEGGHVGPDLTGVGTIRSGHDLLEAVVFPSASFVPGYEIYLVDGGNDRLSGVIRSQSRDALVLVTGPHGEVRIPRNQIKSIQRSNVSLMPDGFDEALTRTELTDLLAFLQAEKTGPQSAAAR